MWPETEAIVFTVHTPGQPIVVPSYLPVDPAMAYWAGSGSAVPMANQRGHGPGSR